MDEEQYQAQIDALKEKALVDRFSSIENRLASIEADRLKMIGWSIRAALLIAAYMFKDPAIRLLDFLRGAK